MKTFLKILFIAVLLLNFTGCYDDFAGDNDESAVCFAVQKPIRTVIADRDMEIYIGVSISGNRGVNMNDRATFEIDASLVEGTGMTLLPSSYYTLANPNTFTVRKSNLPVADVAIKFTDAFYNDPKATGNYYVLPFRVKDSSLDFIIENMDYTIAVIKFISTYHGTYYVKGSVVELDAIGGNPVGNPVTYSESDLINNFTRDFTTRSVNSVVRPGLANLAAGAGNVLLTVSSASTGDNVYNVEVGTAGNVEIYNGSGTYYKKDKESEFVVTYQYTREGKHYKVDETMVLRQDPLYDLRVETW